MSTCIAQGLRANRWVIVVVLSLSLGLPHLGFAHVQLVTPNGGGTLIGGSRVEIKWRVEVAHNTLDWDLWYSTESKTGPWETLGLDIAVGDPSTDSIHTFDWTLPNLALPTAWVRVRQDNGGLDYEDISDASFGIARAQGGGDFTGNGVVDAADLAAWNLGFGKTSGAEPADGDGDVDGDVDGVDFLLWQNDFDAGAGGFAPAVVPEPTTAVLLIIMGLGGAWKKS